MTASPDNRPLADLATNGPIVYDRFLDIAGNIARQLQQVHESGLVYGNLSLHSIYLGPDDEVLLPDPAPAPDGDPEPLFHQDLHSIGQVFASLLTGGQGNGHESADIQMHPILSETMPLDNWSLLLPPEARLLIEQLLSTDPADRISTAHELVVTLDEMTRMHQLPAELAVEAKTVSPRLYAILAIVTLILIIAAILLALFR